MGRLYGVTQGIVTAFNPLIDLILSTLTEKHWNYWAALDTVSSSTLYTDDGISEGMDSDETDADADE